MKGGRALHVAVWSLLLLITMGQAAAAQQDGPIVLRVATHINDPELVEPQIEIMRRFEDLHPGVKIEVWYTDSNNYQDQLLAQYLGGIGPDVAGQMLVTAGENADRLTNEAAFAMLCGVAPLPASSGRTTRHRLNRGGDRAANSALWRIVITRMATDQRTKNYIARRTAQGLTKPEIIRCLKRYVAREVFLALTSASAEKRPAKAA